MRNFDEIINIIDQQQEAHILITALELNIFTVLKNDSLTSKQISLKAKTQLNATKLLLDSLVAMGVLSKKRDHYLNTPVTYKNFCKNSKHYKKGIVMLRLEDRTEWGKLTKIIRKGRELPQNIKADDPKFRGIFSYAMQERSTKFADKIANFTTRKRVGRLLDVGAGPGSYSSAILKKDTQAVATLIDRPAALNVAREVITSKNIIKRISFIEGDIFKKPFGSGYNTILYSNVLHIYNKKENLRIFMKMYKALESSGRIILNDIFKNDNLVDSYNASLFDLTMLLYTVHGKVYSYKEAEQMLKEVGFYKFKRFSTKQGGALIEAIKH